MQVLAAFNQEAIYCLTIDATFTGNSTILLLVLCPVPILMCFRKFIVACFFSLVAAGNSSYANQITCNGNTYTYEKLAGYGLIPGNARDKFGDTIGGIGSSIAMDLKTWTRLSNGSYTGVLWTLPDRGWFVILLES